MHDDRIFSVFEKNYLVRCRKVKSSLEEAGVWLSKPTIKRRIHEWKYSVFTTTCKLLTQQQEGQISQKSSKKTLHSSGKNIWTVESKIKLKWNETERETAHDPKHATLSVRPAGGNIM